MKKKKKKDLSFCLTIYLFIKTALHILLYEGLLLFRIPCPYLFIHFSLPAPVLPAVRAVPVSLLPARSAVRAVPDFPDRSAVQAEVSDAAPFPD